MVKGIVKGKSEGRIESARAFLSNEFPFEVVVKTLSLTPAEIDLLRAS